MSPVAAVKDSEKLSRKVGIANVVDDSIDEAAGLLRVQNRRESLEELSRLIDPPMAKDAVVGRIRRLISMTDSTAHQRRHPRHRVVLASKAPVDDLFDEDVFPEFGMSVHQFRRRFTQLVEFYERANLDADRRLVEGARHYLRYCERTKRRAELCTDL